MTKREGHTVGFVTIPLRQALHEPLLMPAVRPIVEGLGLLRAPRGPATACIVAWSASLTSPSSMTSSPIVTLRVVGRRSIRSFSSISNW